MRTRSLHIALALVCSLFLGCQEEASQPAPAAPAAPAADAALATDEQKTIYAMGYELSKMIAPYNLSDKDLPAFQKGLADGVTKATPKIKLEEFGGPKFAELAKARAAGLAEAQKKEAAPFLAKAATEPGMAASSRSRSVRIISNIGVGHTT